MFKFRGKRLDNGKWAYGDLVRHSKKLLIREHKEGGSWAEHEIAPDTRGVSWGMKDKNGKDVYTGMNVFLGEPFNIVCVIGFIEMRGLFSVIGKETGMAILTCDQIVSNSIEIIEEE